MKIAPGVRLNFSKSGVSTTLGARGFTHTIGKRGQRTNIGLPGTGLSYSHRHKAPTRSYTYASPPEPRSKDPLKISLSGLLFKSKGEKAFIRALQEFRNEDFKAAAAHLNAATKSPDTAFLQGLCFFVDEDYDAAIEHFKAALDGAETLGQVIEKYDQDISFRVNITDELRVRAGCDAIGIHFLLTEIHQAFERFDQARKHADALLKIDSTREEAIVSYADVVLSSENPTNDDLHRIVSLAAQIENEDAVSTIVFIYRARALSMLGLQDAAIDILTQAARRKKDRPQHILNQVVYERALLLHDTGKKARAKKDLEKIYASDPTFADVAERLGIASADEDA